MLNQSGIAVARRPPPLLTPLPCCRWARLVMFLQRKCNINNSSSSNNNNNNNNNSNAFSSSTFETVPNPEMDVGATKCESLNFFKEPFCECYVQV